MWFLSKLITKWFFSARKLQRPRRNIITNQGFVVFHLGFRNINCYPKLFNKVMMVLNMTGKGKFCIIWWSAHLMWGSNRRYYHRNSAQPCPRHGNWIFRVIITINIAMIIIIAINIMKIIIIAINIIMIIFIAKT